MIIKYLRLLLLSIFLFSSLVPAQEYDRSLASLIQTSIELSPKIKMLEAKRSAAYNGIDKNSNLPDPVLTLGLVNIPTNSFSFNQDPMTQKFVGLKQTFPFPGRLGAIEDAAAIDTLIIDQEIADAKNEIRKVVSTKYYRISYLRRALLLSEESKKLLETISEVVSTRYTVASANQQNLVKVYLEITSITEKLEELNSMEKALVAELNALLLRSDNSIIETDDFDKIDLIEINAEELESLAKKYRPYLKGIELAEQKAKLTQNVVEKEFYPNFTLGVQYSYRDKLASTNISLNDLFSVVVGISLPFNYGGKVSAKVEESVSMQKFYSEQYLLALQNLYGNFGSAVSRLESFEERIVLFEEGLLPQAQQYFSSALAGYQVNEVDFLNVIDAQEQLFKIETNLYKLKIDYLTQVVDLEFLVGKSLTK
jgi:outer membrane protein TolC